MKWMAIMPVPGLYGTGLSMDDRWRLLEATPRFRGVVTGGTAVVVGHRNGDLFLLTAEHVARKNSDLTLEFFERGTYPAVARKLQFGSVVEEFAIPDLAVLKFPVGDRRFPAARLANSAERPRRFPVEGLTVGCSWGNPPSVQAVTLSAKRLARRENDREIAFFWETEQASIPGRSGGPLFDGEGRLIGICAATTGGRGYYSHLDEIRACLKSKNLEWLGEASGGEKAK